MAVIFNEKRFSKKWFRDYSLITIGSFAVAMGYVFFITPYKIVPGGVYGIAIVLHYLTGLPVGLLALCFNIPLTIIGVKILGPRFGVKTVVTFFLTAIFVDLQTYFVGNDPLKLSHDILLSCVFGGLVIGIGVGLILKAKATSGGSDVISMILSKFTKLPLGHSIMIVDSTIVLTSLVAFGDWRLPLYSWITIFVVSKVVDTVLQGISYDKTLFIISDKHEEIRKKILNDIHRGGTIIKGEGMYNGSEKHIIYTVVNRRELAMLEEYISQIDPNAFLTVINANEILGQGFKSLNDKLE
ncbi:MAG: YitT family protein [Bacteroidetes bacterium]|nr:YitT family protein [Bacteroidota bacterium]